MKFWKSVYLNSAFFKSAILAGAFAIAFSSCNPNGETEFSGNFYPTVALSPGNSQVSVSNTQVISGNSIRVTVALKDGNGNAFISTLPVVTLQTSGGTSTGTFSAVTNNGDGTYSSFFTALTAGTPTTITPLVDGTLLISSLPTITVVSGNFSLAQSVVNLSAGSVISGSNLTVSLTVKDNSGNPSTSGGLNVSFFNSGGTSTGSFGAVTDHQNGTYTTTFTGAVGGTATAIYATLQGSSITSSLPTVTVIDISPSALTYFANPAVYSKGASITSNTPSNAGGPLNSYTVSPSLPSGLIFNGGTGVISGTPTNITGTGMYTVTATNTGGSTSATVSITVNDVIPSALTYAANPASYTKGTLISNNGPSNSGGSVTGYAVSPALPTGLSLSVMTGIISGTPTVISPATAYTVTASNTGGSTTASISIEVLDVAPSNVTYLAPSPTYTKGAAISSNTPTVTGGTITSFSVSPALPTGLTLNSTSGAITGTPTAVTAATVYTVTATNSGGTITTTLNITVQDIAPTVLTYANNPVTFTKGLASSDSPSNTGGVITHYSVAPSLPAGLSINGTTGVISGTPTVFNSATAYTVTATNTGGMTTVSISIAINDIAPGGLTYSTAPAVYTKGSLITPNNPATSSGGSVVSYAIAPALSAGLSFSTMTGIISGTPTAVLGTTSYTITATNTGGSTSVTFSITVNDIPPSTLTYGTNPATYTMGSAIAPNGTTNSGGVITSYSVNPALPSGLSLNTSTGAVTGTPTAITANTTYTVTGVSSGGNVTASLIITVNDVPPSALTYVSTSQTFTKGTAITSDSVTSSGGAVISYSVAPALPLGLSLSTSTGIISGTPTSVTASQAYTVTALNTGGSTTATLTFAVNDIAPTSLTYVSPSPVYTKGLAITADTNTNTGGAVVSYAIAPPLPAGLSFSTSSGNISGTPTVVSGTTSYTVTATNTGGSTTATLSITVNDVVASNLTYTADPAVYTKGTAITSNTPSSSGGAITGYSVTPSLPAGLILNASTGVITGTPTAVVGATSYTVSASNSGGTVTDVISITVKDVIPSGFSYSANPATYTRGTAIASNTVTISGGVVTGYSVSPSLPTGLSLDTSTGIISGTPSIYTATASYTVTATNSGGSTTATVSILVKDVPLLSYAGATGTAGTVGTAMTVTPTTFSNQGAAITGCAIKTSTTALPLWATLNPSTCVITGTPTGALSSTSYTINAANSVGSSTDASVSLSALYPNPTLASITPSTGTRNGGTTVTLAGTNFYSGITVTLGGNACTSIVVNSTTQITCVTPAHVVGAADVVVTNPGATAATLTSGFNFTAVSLTQTWDFNTASDYTYDHAKISFNGSIAQLIASQQTDNSSSCTTGFGDGVTSGCGGSSTGTAFSSATDGLGSSNYMMLSHAGTATDIELDSTWTPAWPSLVGYWKLNGPIGAISNNSSIPATVGSAGVANSTAMAYTSGKINQAVSFGGSDFVDFGSVSALNIGGSFSFCYWINPASIPSSSVYVIANTKVGAKYFAGSFLTSGAVQCGTFSGNSGIASATSASTLTANTWYNVCYTFDGSYGKIYLNGSLSGTSGLSSQTTLPTGTGDFQIGAREGANFFNGSIDDVAVWNTSLTASAIATIYQHELSAHAGTLMSRVMDGLSSNSWTTLAATTSLPFGKELPDTATTPSPSPVSESRSSYSSLSANLMGVGSGSSGGIVGLWHLDEPSGTTGTNVVLDHSGNGINGSTSSGHFTFGSAGVFGNASAFDGSGSVTLGTSKLSTLFANKTAVTVSAWVKYGGLSTTGVYDNTLISVIIDSTNRGILLGIRGDSGNIGKVIFAARSVPADALQIKTSTTVLTTGQWYHLVGSADFTAKTLSISINGVTTTTSGVSFSSNTYTPGAPSATDSIISGGLSAFTGNIDEVGIWSRGFSSTEVMQLYRRGANRIRYQVRSCPDSTCSTNPTWLGPDGSNQTYFSELNNNSIPKDGADLTASDSVNAGNPTFTFSNFVTASPSPTPFSVPTNQWFQYRAIMESDDTSTSCNYGGTYTATWCSPELKSVAVGPTHYDNTNPTIVNTTGVSYAALQTAFTPTTTCSSNVLYNLSPDAGAHWYWYTAGAWAVADGTVAKANLGGDITSTSLDRFTAAYGAGNVSFKAFLQSGTAGINSCSIDNIDLGITQ